LIKPPGTLQRPFAGFFALRARRRPLEPTTIAPTAGIGEIGYVVPSKQHTPM